MESRLNFRAEEHQDALKAMYGLEQYIRDSGFDKKIVELVKTRCSQINGCAFCIDMHTKDARAAGETEQRLYGLSAWRETSYYTDKERAALEWAEALTLLQPHKVSADLLARTRQVFGDDGIVVLNVIVSTINAWNRIAIGCAAVPGSYQVAAHAA